MRQVSRVAIAVVSVLSGLAATGSPAQGAVRPTDHHPAASLVTKGSFAAVAASSAHNAWAVGTDGSQVSPTTLIAHWNGKKWTRLASPNPGGSALLDGVAIVSARNAWAVGEADGASGSTTLIEHWNGTTWNQVPCPSPGQGAALIGIAAVNAHDLWAVGATTSSSRKTLVLHWDGAVWTRVHSPAPADSGLTGVSMTSAHNGWAVGSGFDINTNQSKSLIEHWNGQTWKRVHSPSPGGDAFLTSVAATSAHNAWAVGCSSYCGAAGLNVPLIERWNGKKWKQVATHLPDGIADGVAASSGHNAWLVGIYYGPSGQSVAASQRALTAHWNGKKWTKVPGPKAGVTSGLTGITAGAHKTWAVGAYGSIHQRTLISRWSGGAWSKH